MKLASNNYETTKDYSINSDSLIESTPQIYSFISYLTHDMKTPINSIISLSEIICKSDNLHKIHNLSKDIDYSCNYLLNLVNDILYLSKIQNSTFKNSFSFYAIEGIFNTVKTILVPLFNEKNINYEFEYSENAPKYIYCDKESIIRVLINLLSNSIKFVDNNGEIKVIQYYHFIDDKKLTIKTKIIDNGIGISEEFKKNLFIPFEQDSTLSSYNKDGSGLGLTIVKKILNFYEGSVYYEEKKGRGTSFVINWAFSYSNTLEESNLQKISYNFCNCFKGKRVLVCDDNKINLKVLKINLHYFGTDVYTANDGKDCIKAFKDYPVNFFDLILIDLEMPILNGEKATSIIRNLPRKDASCIPILVMSSNFRIDELHHYEDSGFSGYIDKPITQSDLFNQLKNYF